MAVASGGAETNAPSLRLDRLPGSRIQITVTGEAQRFHRVDASSNLVSWRPLAVLTNTTGTIPFVDTNAAGIPQRFYRAAEVALATGVTSLSQPNGSAGSQIEIFGQFFDGRPGDNVVRIGDVTARIIEASATRLLVEVPTNATTGPLAVTTPGGETTMKEFFVVTAPVPGTFAPPAGLNGAQFDLVNAYSDGVPLRRRIPRIFFSSAAAGPSSTWPSPPTASTKTFSSR